MPSNKRNSTMERAMGLISSPLNVDSSRNVPFHQPEYIQYMFHGLTFVLYVSVLSLITQGVDLQKCGIASHWLCHVFLLYFPKQPGFITCKSFLHCCSFNAEKRMEHSYKQEYMIIKCTLATNEAQWPTQFSVHN